MKTSRLPELHCPACHGALILAGETVLRNDEVYAGTLQCTTCTTSYPVHNYIPRLLRSPVNYSDSWGKLWRETGALLRDSNTGLPVHRDTIHGHYNPQANVVSGTGESVCGELAVTSYYGKGPWTAWYYPFTRAIPDDRAWEIIARWVPRLVHTKYRITKARIPLLTRLLRKLLEPVDPRDLYHDTLEGRAHGYLHGAKYDRTHDLAELKHFAAINTFDRITCRYTNSATHEDIERWCRAAGFTSVKTWGVGGVRARAVR